MEKMRALRWESGDLDLEHGTVHIHDAFDRRTGNVGPLKDWEARRFKLEPNLLPLLRAMRDEARGHGRVLDITDKGGMANTLRRWLRHAGIERPELFTTTETSKAITFHDLRATGITWMAVRGDNPHLMRQRSGHEHLSTLEIYIRQAHAIGDGFGVPFPPLPACLLGGGSRAASDDVVSPEADGTGPQADGDGAGKHLEPHVEYREALATAQVELTGIEPFGSLSR
jgi:hypothetical protein